MTSAFPNYKHSPYSIKITSPRIYGCEFDGTGSFTESRQIDTSRLPSRIEISGPSELLCADRRIVTREKFCRFDETDHWAFQLGLCWWRTRHFSYGDKAKLSRFWPEAEADMICEQSEVKMSHRLTSRVIFRGVVRCPE